MNQSQFADIGWLTTDLLFEVLPDNVEVFKSGIEVGYVVRKWLRGTDYKIFKDKILPNAFCKMVKYLDDNNLLGESNEKS